MSDVIEFEDIFGKDAFNKALHGVEKLTQSFKDMASQLSIVALEQKDFIAALKINNSSEIKKLNEELSKASKTINDLNRANKAVAQGELELARIRTENAKLIKEEAKANQEKQKTQQQSIKTEIEYQKLQKISNTERKKTLDAYQKESKALNDLRNKYKAVAAEQGINSKAAQDLLRKLEPLDKKLKGIDASAGQFQRNVGNYSSAFNKFGSSINNILGAAGIGVGLSAGFDFLKDSLQEFSKLESSLQNLSAITGASGKDLEFFKEQAKELGLNVKGGASAVVEAYKLIGSAKPELLENKDALNEVTKSAILLSQAAGLELPDAATRLTDALNQYGASADQAGKFTDVLAAGAKAGAAEVPDITEALLKFGVAAKSSNISVQESVGAIELLAEKGIKGAEAGTQLRNVFSKLSAADVLPREALKQLSEAGVNINILKDAALPLNVRLKELSKISGDASAITKVFGLENKAAGEILISNLPRLQALTSAVDENGVAMQQAGVNTDTFAFKQQRLGNIWDEFKSSIGEFLVGAGDDLLDFYDYLFGKLTNVDVALKRTAKSRRDLADVISTKDIADQQKLLKEIDIQLRALEVLKVGKGDEAYELERKMLIDLRNQIVANSKENTKAIYAKIQSTNASNSETKATDENTDATKKNTKAKKDADARAKENYENYQKELQIKKDIAAEDDVVIPEEEAKRVKTQKEIEQEINDEKLNQSALAYEAQKKLDDEAASLRKEQREKERKEAFDAANQLLEIAEKRINQEQDLINDAIDSEINKRQNALDEQKRRAEQGLSSDIATAEKNLKDAEARKKDIENQAIKRQQALTFFKLLSANAESDPNNALTKTFTEMLLSEALVKSLPGFFKGTENVERDLKGNKVHNGRDGHVIAVDGGERVMTGDQNKLMGGMANDDVANLVYRHNNNLLPNYMISEPLSPMGVAENMYNSIQLQQLVKQNEELIKAVKSIPGTNIMFSDGKMKRTDNVNGFKTTTIKPLTRGYDN